MSLDDKFRALREVPGVARLGLAWEAGEDAAGESPLLHYVMRLHVLFRLRDVLAETGSVEVRKFIEELIASLQKLKPALPAPFEANYAEAKAALRFNYQQCVDDQLRDELSKDLYVGFFKLMTMYEALGVFDARACDVDRAQLDAEMEDCKALKCDGNIRRERISMTERRRGRQCPTLQSRRARRAKAGRQSE